jgi:hypothetical protein
MSNKNCGPDLVKYIVVQPSTGVITGSTGDFNVCNGVLFAEVISGCTDSVNLNGNIFYNDGPVSFGSSVSACTSIYTSNIYGCSPITVHDDLILLTGLTLNTIINDDSLAQVLVRDNVTGLVKYRDAASLISASDKHVTGTTFVNDLVLLTRNDGFDVLKLSGGTNVTLSNPSTNLIKIDLNIPSTINTFVTGFTYDNVNTFTIGRNDGVNLSTTISTLSGVTYYGDGVGLNNIPISGVTNLQTELDSKLNISNFNVYSGNVQTQLNGKIDSANNVGGANEIFKDKSGTTLNFRTISGGSNTTISTIGDVIKVDVTIPPDTNTFVTGTTFTPNQAVLTRNDGFDVLKLSGGSNVTLSNPSTNQIKIDVNIPAGVNTFVTGGTYNDLTNTITLSRNDGGTINITGVTDSYVTGATLNGNNLELGRNEGLPTVSVDLSSIDTNYYVTGATFTNNLLTLERSGGLSNINVNIDNFTGLTVNGSVSATTYYGDGSNLTGISTVDNYTTGATLNGSTLIFNRTDALSAYTVSLAGLVTTGGTETKELFFGDEEFTINNAGRSYLTTTSTGFLSFAGVGQVDDAGVSFRIPLDYNSEPQFSVQWTMDGTSSTANTVNYNLNITTGRTTTINEHTVVDETVSIVDEAYSGTAWRILQTPYSSSTITYNPGDYIHVELERDPSDGSDTMNDTAYVSGLIFRYKANK